MKTINLYEAKNNFSKLVDAAEGGEVIVIARHGRAAAKLVPLAYGERREWSPALKEHMQKVLADPTTYDPDDFIDRSDLLPLAERDLF